MKDCRWAVSALCAIFAGEREGSTCESLPISLDRVLTAVVRNDIRCIDNFDENYCDSSQSRLVRQALFARFGFDKVNRICNYFRTQASTVTCPYP